MNFNLKLKKIRTFRKMTQKELSEKIGLTAINDIENCTI